LVLLALVGIGLSAKLAWVHAVTQTGVGSGSICNVNDYVSCDTVSTSKYASFLGVPVATWGILGYSLMLATAVAGKVRRWSAAPGLLLLLSGFAVLTSMALAAISVFWIGAICLFCIATYVVDFGVLGLSWWLGRRVAPPAAVRRVVDAAKAGGLTWPAVAALAAAAGLIGLHRLPGVAGDAAAHGSVTSSERAPHAAGGPPAVSHGSGVDWGRDEGGHFWLGGGQPTLVIEEFSDYQCPHCRAVHAKLRQLVLEAAGKVKLVHHHFPLDEHCNPMLKRPFHPKACQLSALAQCAGVSGKFWDANDRLFELGAEDGPVDVPTFARTLGLETSALQACVDAPETKAALGADITLGMELKLRGTPAFRIDGKVYMAGIPGELLRAVAPHAAATFPPPAVDE